MTVGTADPPFRHELVLHEGTPALIDLMVPFVREGAEAGEQVLVVGEPAFVAAMVAAVPEVPDVVAVPESGRARFPGRDLRLFRRVVSTLQAGAPRVRVVNQMPTMATDEWQEWRRYEAAVNVALAPYRVWGTCAYDAQRLDDAMRTDLLASHPHVLTGAGGHRSEPFADLETHQVGYLAAAPHPIEATEPQAVLSDPTAAAARDAVRRLAAATDLPVPATEVAVLAVNETVTNASRHGRAPVTLRAWTGGGRLTVTVTDAGAGAHPLVGLLPAAVAAESGRGMWMLHQLLGDLHHRVDDDGYTVRFSVGSGTAPDLT